MASVTDLPGIVPLEGIISAINTLDLGNGPNPHSYVWKVGAITEGTPTDLWFLRPVPERVDTTNFWRIQAFSCSLIDGKPVLCT